MKNPFETKEIKNYILLYVGVVIIMILFFVAATLFRDTKVIEKKSFDTNKSYKTQNKTKKQQTNKTLFRLME